VSSLSRGVTLDSDAFRRAAALHSDYVWHRGDQEDMPASEQIHWNRVPARATRRTTVARDYFQDREPTFAVRI
jgi:hypothetical protein